VKERKKIRTLVKHEEKDEYGEGEGE